MKTNTLLLAFFAISCVFIVCNADGYSRGNGNGSNKKHGDFPRNNGYGKGPKGDYGSENSVKGLHYDFYRYSCPRAEEIVRSVTQKHVLKNPGLPAKLLRMYFHDCFVTGCDASILLNSMNGVPGEREAIPNLSLGGFEVIDEIKTEIEKVCYQTVSCADILALSTRDAVSVQYGGRQLWKVPTGRRDGTETLASKTSVLTSPFADFATLKSGFASKGFSVLDLVALSGAHTIGMSHCNLISSRLFNFTGKGDQDPSLDNNYALFLKKKCQNDATSELEMDPASSTSFDSHYYAILKNNQGFFTSDAALLTDPESSSYVQKMVNPNYFLEEFGNSMLKLGYLDVLTGSQGQIRKTCAHLN